MKIEILFEDKDYVVINKPVGLIVHSDGKREEPTVADWMLETYPKTKDVGESITLSDGRILLRPGIVHRIDRETSGTLVLCKNQKAFLALKEQFKAKTVKKTYHAFVYGEMKEKEGVIDRSIGRSRKDFRMWSAQRGARGEMREAVTEYRVLATDKKASLVEAEPKTGRTHQIRVHFKAINHPLVADSLYAPNHHPVFGFERLALHALRVEFVDLKGKVMTVEAPYPADFKKAVKEMEKPE